MSSLDNFYFFNANTIFFLLYVNSYFGKNKFLYKFLHKGACDTFPAAKFEDAVQSLNSINKNELESSVKFQQKLIFLTRSQMFIDFSGGFGILLCKSKNWQIRASTNEKRVNEPPLEFCYREKLISSQRTQKPALCYCWYILSIQQHRKNLCNNMIIQKSSRWTLQTTSRYQLNCSKPVDDHVKCDIRSLWAKISFHRK